MLDIELFKKGCVFAEGFEIHKSLAGTYFLEYKEDDDYRLVLDSVALDSDCEDVLYKSFLQEAIEGINRRFADDTLFLYSIKQDYSDIEVFLDYEIDETFEINNNPDQAKEQAIKYILDLL